MVMVDGQMECLRFVVSLYIHVLTYYCRKVKCYVLEVTSLRLTKLPDKFVHNSCVEESDRHVNQKVFSFHLSEQF